MQPLTTMTSVVAPLVRDNVDTDAIIPASYMRSLATDPGTGLFARWRYRSDGSEDPAFVLNDPRYRSARILLGAANFGCGSSRENAVWALERFGIRCIVALGYSDIFYENCFKNGVLPVVLGTRNHDSLVRATAQHAPYHVTLDVAAGTITGDDGVVLGFDLDERKRALLLEGIDEIGATLAAAASIRAFREQHRRDKPWLYGTQDKGPAGGVQ